MLWRLCDRCFGSYISGGEIVNMANSPSLSLVTPLQLLLKYLFLISLSSIFMKRWTRKKISNIKGVPGNFSQNSIISMLNMLICLIVCRKCVFTNSPNSVLVTFACQYTFLCVYNHSGYFLAFFLLPSILLPPLIKKNPSSGHRLS